MKETMLTVQLVICHQTMPDHLNDVRLTGSGFSIMLNPSPGQGPLFLSEISEGRAFLWYISQKTARKQFYRSLSIQLGLPADKLSDLIENLFRNESFFGEMKRPTELTVEWSGKPILRIGAMAQRQDL